MSKPETVKQRKRGLLAWVPAAAKKLRAMGRRTEAAQLEREAKAVRLTGAMGKPARTLLAHFQRLHKLAPTGVWNSPTIKAIRRWLPFVPEYRIHSVRYAWNGGLGERIGALPGIVLHNLAAAEATPQEIHDYHLSRGFRGIGYHAYVRKDGTIWRGRPESVIGAHCLGHNDMLGICAEGNFDVETTMSEAQVAALRWLVRSWQAKYRCAVYLHRELNATSCPGKNYPVGAVRG